MSKNMEVDVEEDAARLLDNGPSPRQPIGEGDSGNW